MNDSTDTQASDHDDRQSATFTDRPTVRATHEPELAAAAESELLALETEAEEARLRTELERFRQTFPRRRQPGGNDLERQRYLMAQQRLRWYARCGITLELDEDGAPMPHASGTDARLPTDPWTLPTSLPTLKVRDAATLGRIIRLWRRRINESVTQLAHDSDQSTRFIASLERGESQLALARILRVIDALDMELLIRPRRSSLRE